MEPPSLGLSLPCHLEEGLSITRPTGLWWKVSASFSSHENAITYYSPWKVML
jgi:hypothetical protein